MFQSTARLGCIKQLLLEAEKASGMLRFLLRNLEKLGFCHFFGALVLKSSKQISFIKSQKT